MRTAPQKMRNRSNANQANVIQSSPRTRVNRYIGRLIEARQTESDTADLNFLTLMYKCSEREHRVRDLRNCTEMLLNHVTIPHFIVWLLALFGFCHCAVPPGAWWVLHQRSGPLPDPSCFVWPCLSSHHTTVCTKNASVGPFFVFLFFFFPFPLFYLSSCLFNIPKSVLLTPSFPSLLFSLSGAQWC